MIDKSLYFILILFYINNMKYTLDSVKDYINNQGYTLLDSEYCSSQIKLNIRCPNGHTIHPTFSEFKRKARCNDCSGNRKPTIEEINTFLAPEGFKVLSDVYVNNNTKLTTLCPKNHIWDITWLNLKYGNRCPHCFGNAKIHNKITPTVQGLTHAYLLEEVVSFYQTKGFKLLSTSYINSKSKLSIQCDKEHIFETTFAVSLKGFGCPTCSENKKYTIEDVRSFVGQFNYTLVSDKYVNNRSKIVLMCPEKHTYSTTFGGFKAAGNRCPSCSHQTSQAEKEILVFVRQYYPNAEKVKFYEIIPQCPKEYRNKELDIYIPELRTALEYCGLFWHSEASGDKNPNNHKNKLKWCRENNIKLITIFEDEWLSRKEQVKNLLLSIMKIHRVKIGARKCEVQILDKYDAKTFINSNHIQPLHDCKIAFGLFHAGELIGAITGNKHHRNGNEDFVLQRLCFKSGFQVAGGASKLLKPLVLYAKQEGYSRLVSWSDSRISEGNVYNKLGFEFKVEYSPDCSYVKNGESEVRFSKQALKKTPEERLTGKTEAVLRREQGYYRIWDCGKKLWCISL